MKKTIRILWIASLIGFSVPVLASPNEQIGTVVGGIAGGIIGNNIGHGSSKAATTIGGAVVGSLVGNQIGSNVDASTCYQRAHYHRPMPVYTPTYGRTFIGRDGRLCRRSILRNEFGERVVVTYCCYRSLPNGYCSRWIRVG
jgi:uncharacterized protein YcfJ